MEKNVKQMNEQNNKIQTCTQKQMANKYGRIQTEYVKKKDIENENSFLFFAISFKSIYNKQLNHVVKVKNCHMS